MILRKMVEIPKYDSCFLLGPRQTGKSTLVRYFLKNKPHLEIDLLDIDTFRKYSADLGLLYKELEYEITENNLKSIFIDEIQKLPELLDSVQKLIDKYSVQFILSGSSARKLKRLHANLLGGRAIVIQLYPLNYWELNKDYHFEKKLKYGSLAGLYKKSEIISQQKLKSYVDTYLKEEVAQEGLVRNLLPFSRFIEFAARLTTEIVNFENISRESSISAKTIQSYYQILEDTFIGYYLPNWDQSLRKQLSKHPKFYFFDNGITTALNNSLRTALNPQLRGAHFEQLMINEIKCLNSYEFHEVDFHFWRTLAGNEVDLILSRAAVPFAAIEFKNKIKISNKDLSGLRSFSEDYPSVKNLYCVCDVSKPYKIDTITIIPWDIFLKKEIFKILKR